MLPFCSFVLINEHMPLKICHIADTHLGYKRFYRLTKNGHNQREIDVCAVFEAAVNKIIEIKPDLIIIAGDLFDSVRPSNFIVTYCYRQLKKLSDYVNAPIVIVAGNHETPKKSETGCIVKLFEELPDIYCADMSLECFEFKHLDCAVICIPYNALENLNKERVSLRTNRKHNILVLHGQVMGSRFSDLAGNSFDLNSIGVHLWSYVALGHVHIAERIGINAAYSGSLEFVSPNFWQESLAPKGFYEVHLPGPTLKFHAVSPREVHVLKAIDASDLSASQIIELLKECLNTIPGGLEDKIVKLEIYQIDRQTLKELDYKEIRKLKSQIFHLSLDLRAIKQTESSRVVNEEKSFTILDELINYTEASGVQAKNLPLVFKEYYSKVCADEETR